MKVCKLCEATSAGTAVRFINRSALCTYCWAELKRTARGWCPRCEKVYPMAEMRDKGQYCVVCARALKQAKYARSREKRLAYQRAYREAHQAEQRAANAAYYQAHKERITRRKRLRYAADPIAARQRYARYRSTEQERERKRLGYARWPSHRWEYRRVMIARRRLAILRGQL